MDYVSLSIKDRARQMLKLKPLQAETSPLCGFSKDEWEQFLPRRNLGNATIQRLLYHTWFRHSHFLKLDIET
ncbi:hypothetical protein FQZ97_798770 [compost metagenome]